MTDKRAKLSRARQLDLLDDLGPDRIVSELAALTGEAPAQALLPHLIMPAHHDVRSSDVFTRRLHGTLAAAAERGPVDFPDLLLTPGVGARTVRSLAMVAEVVHGAPYRFRDPARFSLAHGGKDRHPYPVPIKVYDARHEVGRPEREACARRGDAGVEASRRSGAAARTDSTGTLFGVLCRNGARCVDAAGRQVRIRMGKGSDVAKGGGVVATEDLKVTKLGRGTIEVPGTPIRRRPLEGPQFSRARPGW